MHKAYKILGIDLGGCMSGNSGYIYATVEGSAINVHEAFKELKHQDHIACHRYLVDMCSRFDVDAIAIDAPLSLPKALTDVSFSQYERPEKGEITNPFLYRYTDYYIWKNYGLKPMPPAGDRIGRLTARAVALLQQLEYKFPEIRIGDERLPIFEVYPKQVAKHLGFTEYKKDPMSLLKCLNTEPVDDPHLIDALLCCFAGAQILAGNTVMPDSHIQQEGWCFPIC